MVPYSGLISIAPPINSDEIAKAGKESPPIVRTKSVLQSSQIVKDKINDDNHSGKGYDVA